MNILTLFVKNFRVIIYAPVFTAIKLVVTNTKLFVSALSLLLEDNTKLLLQQL